MKYAIIAAGEGSRLVEEGISVPKPLVHLNGISMIDRLINIFVRNKASSIAIIVNEYMKEVQIHLQSLQLPVPLNVIVKSTESSMHSFYELMPYLKEEKFCLTTVDTIFHEKEFSGYISEFSRNNEIDGLMAVTDYIDDEKPLYVKTNEEMTITGFSSEPNSKFVSGGIYCLSPNVLPLLQEAVEKGISRMRNFQQAMVEAGVLLKAYPFDKIVDVDHVEDINKAEKFIRTE
ncbi:MAG: NTP transferase domain-containing protein [Candidatus Azobacteroides sp.]|nr:NTP transferase domain-containing protein [Candidatus Azobacteroides sp.]